MNLTSKKVIKSLFKRYQAQPSKKLGQNFLIDKKVVKKFIKACNLTKKDGVLEIGPGIGVLTQEIAKGAKQVIGIEKDLKMVEILKETMRDFKNIKILQGDILKFKSQESRVKDQESYKVVGNLPFYLTTPVIRKFLEFKNPPREMTLMVQKEVAQRICAKPPKMSILAVSVQFYAEPEIISFVSKKSFWPSPKVDSAIMKLKLKSQKFKVNAGLFFKIVKVGFAHPRKQLVNNLSKGLKIDKEKLKNWLFKNNIKPKLRAEALTVENWINLTKSFKIR